MHFCFAYFRVGRMPSRQSKFIAFVGFETGSSWQRWWVGAGCAPKTRQRCNQWGASRESRQRARPIASKTWKRQNTSSPSLWIVKCLFRYLSLFPLSWLLLLLRSCRTCEILAAFAFLTNIIFESVDFVCLTPLMDGFAKRLRSPKEFAFFLESQDQSNPGL